VYRVEATRPVGEALCRRKEMQFGGLLHRARVAVRRSLRDVGQEVGLSAIYLSEIERGGRRPPATPYIMRLAAALNTDSAPLLEAAMNERDRVELSLEDDSTPAKKELGLALARAWDDMDDAVAKKLKEFLEERGGL
jgi:transcriptional regulator with XRE-family HTH domain